MNFYSKEGSLELAIKRVTKQKRESSKEPSAIAKYWGAEYLEDDVIVYEKQEDGKIIHKNGKIKEILVKQAHQGKKINRYYIVEDNESNEYAVHEDCVVRCLFDGINTKKRNLKKSEIKLMRKLKTFLFD